MKAYSDEPNDTWAEAIARMTDEQIITALKTLAEQGGAHPPTLPEFVKASVGIKPETGSPRYLGVPTTPTALRLGMPEKRVHDVSALKAALRGQS